MLPWNRHQAGYSVAGKGRAKEPQVELVDLFNEHVYRGAVATDTTQEYYRELRPGDTITARTMIDSISPRKSAGLGVGCF